MTLWRHRSLVFELTRREFAGHYRGSFGGLIWSFAQPLLLLSVYTIAFGVILKARWGVSGGTGEYALVLFAGLIVFNAFAECLNRAPVLITDNPNFVKKIVFPLELLPWVMALTAVLRALIGVVVWLVGYTVLFGLPHPSVILFPLVLLSFFPFLLGIGWLLAALGVMVRDIHLLTGLLAQMLLFLTPIFYSVDMAPPFLQRLLTLNPLTLIVEQFQLVLFAGRAPEVLGLTVYFALSVLFARVSLVLFRRLRPAFADKV